LFVVQERIKWYAGERRFPEEKENAESPRDDLGEPFWAMAYEFFFLKLEVLSAFICGNLRPLRNEN
jgi:hypothetical protein